MWLSTDSSTLIPIAYQTFIFVSNSIKLGRARSSDAYSVQKAKVEVFFITVYTIYVNHGLSYYCTPLILPCGLCYNYAHVQTVCTKPLSPPPPPHLEMRLTIDIDR